MNCSENDYHEYDCRIEVFVCVCVCDMLTGIQVYCRLSLAHANKKRTYHIHHDVYMCLCDNMGEGRVKERKQKSTKWLSL